jgi:hypothetical protein
MKWGEVRANLTPLFMQNAAAAFSAARVFHTWIDDQDHNGNDGNVIVDVSSSDDVPGVAFIDHAFAMSRNPNFAASAVQPLGIHYISQNLSNDGAIAKMCRYINELEASMIEDIVRRVPSQFLPSARAGGIIQGLLSRRLELFRVFGVGSV